MAFQGSLKELPLPDIIQLVSVSGKTGVFALSHDSSSGEIFLQNGDIVHAKTASLEGEEAVYELAVWTDGDFVFHPEKTATTRTIKRSNTNLLMEAARRIDEWQVLSKRIPSTSLVPIFTEQAKKSSVSLTPAEWGLIAKIDERRSIEEIAIALESSPFEVSKLLYGLITSGLIALTQGLQRFDLDRLQKMTVEELSNLVVQIHRIAQRLLTGHPQASELNRVYRLSQVELQGGRSLDAVLDLYLAEEKLVASTLGLEAAEGFSKEVATLLEA